MTRYTKYYHKALQAVLCPVIITISNSIKYITVHTYGGGLSIQRE